MNSAPFIGQHMYHVGAPYHMMSQHPSQLPPPYWQSMMMNSMGAPMSFPPKKRPADQMEEKITLGGKWTAEEEAYAGVLIQHFRTGALPDCEDGTTLRSYLAEKLECIPMRISKKFAGIKIGKEIFRRGCTNADVVMQLNYIRELFVQSTSKKRKRIKRKLLKASASAKDGDKETGACPAPIDESSVRADADGSPHERSTTGLSGVESVTNLATDSSFHVP